MFLWGKFVCLIVKFIQLKSQLSHTHCTMNVWTFETIVNWQQNQFYSRLNTRHAQRQQRVRLDWSARGIRTTPSCILAPHYTRSRCLASLRALPMAVLGLIIVTVHRVPSSLPGVFFVCGLVFYCFKCILSVGDGRTSGHCCDPRSITIVFQLVFTPASHHVITTAPGASSNHNKCIHASESHAHRKWRCSDR